MSIFENIAINMNMPKNTSGTDKATGSINNVKNELLKDMALKLLNALENGDSATHLELKAQVQDIMQNQLMLTLPDGSVISGRTDTLLPLSIGDTATFNVSMSTDGKIVLSLAADESTAEKENRISIDNPLVKRALSAANIPINPRSLSVTAELLNAGQSVSTDNIRKFITLSHKNPDIPVKELVLLSANKIPLTPENLQAFKEISNGSTVWETTASSPAVTGPVPEIIKDFAATTLDAAPSAGPDAMPKPPTTPAQTAMPEPATTSAQAAAPEPATTSAQAAAPESATTSAQATPVSHFFPSIEPKDFNEEAVKSFYNYLNKTGSSTAAPKKAPSTPLPADNIPNKETTELLEKSLNNAPAPATVADKLQLMQDINNIFPFIQIPVKLQEENAKGELYVFEKRKKYHPDEPLTAVLHLELEHLGTTDIKVTLLNSKVTAYFEVFDDKAANIFKEEIPALSQRLKALGFTLDSDFKVREAENNDKPLLYQFLEAHSPKAYSRYTFDVHA